MVREPHAEYRTLMNQKKFSEAQELAQRVHEELKERADAWLELATNAQFQRYVT